MLVNTDLSLRLLPGSPLIVPSSHCLAQSLLFVTGCHVSSCLHLPRARTTGTECFLDQHPTNELYPQPHLSFQIELNSEAPAFSALPSPCLPPWLLSAFFQMPGYSQNLNSLPLSSVCTFHFSSWEDLAFPPIIPPLNGSLCVSYEKQG